MYLLSLARGLMRKLLSSWFARASQPAGRKDHVEVTRWSHVRDTKLWMEQITTCLDANKMDEHLLQVSARLKYQPLAVDSDHIAVSSSPRTCGL